MTTIEQTLWKQHVQSQIDVIDEQLEEARRVDSSRSRLLQYALVCKKIELLQALLDRNHN